MRSNRFSITSFSTDNSPFPFGFDPEIMNYLCYQLERCPDTYRLHWQVYLELHKRHRVTGVKKIIGNKAHIELCKGQPSENRKYCSKDDTAMPNTFQEYGEITPDVEKQQGKRTDCTKIIDLIKQGKTDGEILTECSSALRMLNYLQKARSALSTSTYREDLKVIYIYGPSGSGKSYQVYNKIKGESYNRPLISESKIWFEGYTSEKIIWLDDIDFRHYNREYILHILDKYPLSLQYKGGSAPANYTTVYITSNIDPLYYDKAIQRRITETIFLEDCKKAGTKSA